MYTFQEIVAKLSAFWQKHGCVISMPYDIEKGAGTSNPITFFRSLGPEPYRAAYIEPCRRPKDGRYGTNPLRMQHYFQYQVILKPSPLNIQELYLESLESIGFTLSDYDIRFVHDDWEQPSIGAWGLGWEVWIDGMECSQFTYFQSMAEIPVKPVTGELTYGIERLIMQLQKVDNFKDIQWTDTITYGDLYSQNEIEWSEYNFEALNPDLKLRDFDSYISEIERLVEKNLPLVAYDYVLKASHAFNLLDAQGIISVSERQSYIQKIRKAAKLVATSYLESRKKQGYPLLDKWKEPAEQITVEKPKSTPTFNETETFLLEIGTEELPATFVSIGLASLEKQLTESLNKKGLTFESIKTYGTPRRLAIQIENLATKTKKEVLEKKGPKLSIAVDADGNLTKIGTGFLHSLGITLTDTETREIKGEKYLFATVIKEPVEAYSLLTESLADTILAIEFPKEMRWKDFDITFARPIRWCVALLGNTVIPFAVGPVVSSRTTFGHKQLQNHAIELNNASEYSKKLEEHAVIADQKIRRDEIIAQLEKIEAETKTRALSKNRVADEVCHLVEKPFLAVGTFDETYLQLPKEVLVSEMVEHQKYFPLEKCDSTLSNHFVITANVPATESIIHGNKRVLTSRLQDGTFLFEQDQKTPLIAHCESLKQIIYQKGLGSLFDKVKRIEALSVYLAEKVGVDKTHAAEAALLCKADLATEMVGEFPELQGIMGRVYAQKENKPESVAWAIEEHWMPKGEKSGLPKSALSSIVSIADKLDTLVGFFALDIKPTSSSDPFALKRQAIGILRILIENKWPLSLLELVEKAASYYSDTIQNSAQEKNNELLGYFRARLEGVLTDKGFSKDLIAACLAVRPDTPYDVYLRLESLKKIQQDPVFDALIEVHKRCTGQINGFSHLSFSQDLLQEEAEILLNRVFEKTEALYSKALTEQEYEKAFTILCQYQMPLESLFDTVKILADDVAVKENRIALLQKVAQLFMKIADFQKLQKK